MAQRDKSQGIGFVYVDLKEILSQRDRLYREPHYPAGIESKNKAQVVNLNRDRGPIVERRLAPAAPVEQTVSLTQIRENLDRLQALHHKLHAVLEELSTAADRRKK